MFFPVRLFILHLHAPSCSLFPDEAQFRTIKRKLRNSTTKKANTIPQQRHLNSWNFFCSCWWGVCGEMFCESVVQLPAIKKTFLLWKGFSGLQRKWYHVQGPLFQAGLREPSDSCLALVIFIGRVTVEYGSVVSKKNLQFLHEMYWEKCKIHEALQYNFFIWAWYIWSGCHEYVPAVDNMAQAWTLHGVMRC